MDKPHTHDNQSCCDSNADSSQVTDKTHTDLVCGMQVDVNPNKAVEHSGITYYFCSQHCVEKFCANPQEFVKKHTGAQPETSMPANNATSVITNKPPLYTCPMHPEVQQVGPGNCPKCGMTLEPMDASTEEDTSELSDMTRRFS